jgi:amino acid adenylation domain-containing protein
MEVKARAALSPDAFWKSVFSDLESTGILRGLSRAHAPAGTLNSQVQLALTPWKGFALPAKPNTLLCAAWAVVLSRHTSSSDVIFHTSHHEREPWISPLRVIVPPKLSFAAWLPEFEEQLEQTAHAGPLPIPLLAQMREEGLDRTAPAFIIVSPDATTFPPREEIRSPLLLIVRLDIGMIELHYDSSWFEESEVSALGHHLNRVLRAMAETPETTLGRLPILTDEEQRKILDEWNDTRVPFAETTCVHQFFEEQARRTPDAVAAVFCDQTWTYQELDAHANHLAQRLRRAGVERGTFVAICVNRSLELMATLLAVLKAGGAYVPLDPSYPPERLSFMIEDAKPAVIAVSKQTAENFSHGAHRLVMVDEPGDEPAGEAAPTTASQASDAAYVLYTSGSTGKPKGVVITHRNVSNFFTAMDGVIGTEAGVWLAVTSVNFDISVFELFWTLARGFRVIIQEEGQWASATDSMYSLPQQMQRHGVTHLQCTPSLASMLLADSDSVHAIKQLRRFMVGGESLPLDLARRLAEIISGDLYNLYGPTETTVWSASQHVPRGAEQILIGRPVANNRLYVLDGERQLAPVGAKGELHIGGDGLAREYLNRPDITRERFIDHTFGPGRTERLYATGDVVRQLADGRLEFLGRSDNQIKIRGVRIELGEIEMALREHPKIRDAVVIVQEDDTREKRLVAYAIARPGETPGASALQQWLGTKLPKAVIPSAVLFLTEFPKTPNGKLDRRALPKPEQNSPAASGHEASTELERQVAAIWAETLGVPGVGLDERFFDLGGHSLLMVEVHDKLRDQAGYHVPLLDLFQFPTVRSLANHLRLQSGAARDEKTSSGKLRGKLRLQSLARHALPRKNPPVRGPS